MEDDPHWTKHAEVDGANAPASAPLAAAEEYVAVPPAHETVPNLFPDVPPEFAAVNVPPLVPPSKLFDSKGGFAGLPAGVETWSASDAAPGPAESLAMTWYQYVLLAVTVLSV